MTANCFGMWLVTAIVWLVRTGFFFGGVLVGIVLGGCAREQSAEPTGTAGSSDAGDDGMRDGQADVGEGGDADAWSDRGDENTSSIPPTLIVGLVPTPQSVWDGGTMESAQAEAVLSSLSAGARGLVLSYGWSDLAPASAPEPMSRWAWLRNLGEFLRPKGKVVLLSIRCTDTTVDTRPLSVRGMPWDDANTSQAMHDLIDKLFATMGSEFRYLSLAFEIDQYVAAHPEQQDAVKSFAMDALGYAKSHPSRPSGQRVGVTWSTRVWLGGGWDPVGLRRDLVDASDVLMMSYVPIDNDLRSKTPSLALSEIESLAIAKVDKPIVIHELAYSSSTLIGSSEASQAEFFRGLFPLIGTYRVSIPFVGISGLHDPTPNDCLARSTAKGTPGSAELYAFWCSTGLRTRDGMAKESFTTFLTGAPTFLEP